MTWLLVTVFVASLLGSMHCVGMCGPFALLAGGSGRSGDHGIPNPGIWWPAFFYNAGRLVTYAGVGVLFGAAGLAMNTFTGQYGDSVSWWQRSATWVAGLLMIAVGSVGISRHLGWAVPLPSLARPLQKLLQRQFRRTRALSPYRRALAIGMLTSLMPCGWLYAFAITAAGTGSPLAGMLVMAAFWCGSVPVLMALVPGVNLLKRMSFSAQRRIPLLMSGLVILTGIFTLMYRAPVTVVNTSPTVSGYEQLQQQVGNIQQEELPCCHGGGGQ